jgi:hypothetical protein
MACLGVLLVGVGATLWPGLQGRPVDWAAIARLAVLAAVTSTLLVLYRRRGPRP